MLRIFSFSLFVIFWGSGYSFHPRESSTLRSEPNQETQTSKSVEEIKFKELEIRAGIHYLAATSIPYTGKAVSFYSNGQKKLERFVKNGRLEGLGKDWHRNGNLKAEGTFQNGEMNGLWTIWFENGSKRSESTYKSGKLNGKEIGWHLTGYRAYEGSYLNDSPDGMHFRWHNDGKKFFEKIYQNGTEEGIWRWWNDAGEKRLIEKFENGERVKSSDIPQSFRSKTAQVLSLAQVHPSLKITGQLIGDRKSGGFENLFELADSSQLVIDYSSGLIWQQSGSEKAIAYNDAISFINELNRKKFKGYSDWRLPTLDEALTILIPKEQKIPMKTKLYINRVFDDLQMSIWIGDSSRAGYWVVLFKNGVCTESIAYNKHYVRAVR